MDEAKVQNRRVKELSEIPLNLMFEPQKIKQILDDRLSELILQPLKFHQFSLNEHNTAPNWDKASLHCDIMPGDLSYDNINLSEKLEYYVEALKSLIIPSTVRVGDKIFNMSQIPGREKSVILAPIKECISNESIVFDNVQHEEKLISCEISNETVKSSIKDDSLNQLCQNNLRNEEISKNSVTNIFNSDRFMSMFNCHRYSDLLILLQSGEILNLHKFVLAAWQCNDDSITESQYFIPSVEDSVVIRFFKHLYSDGKFPIDDLIDNDDCKLLCQKFGIDHTLLHNRSIGPSTEVLDIMSPIRAFNLNTEIFHSTPYCNFEKTNSSAFGMEKLTSFVVESSDSDLFKSLSQDLSCELSKNQTVADKCKDNEKLKSSEEIIDFSKSLPSKENVYFRDKTINPEPETVISLSSDEDVKMNVGKESVPNNVVSRRSIKRKVTKNSNDSFVKEVKRKKSVFNVDEMNCELISSKSNKKIAKGKPETIGSRMSK